MDPSIWEEPLEPDTADAKSVGPAWNRSHTKLGTGEEEEEDEAEGVPTGDTQLRSTAPSMFRGGSFDVNEVKDAITFLQARNDTIEDLTSGRMLHRNLRARIRLLVMDRRFEAAVACIIVINSVYIGVETHSTMADEENADMKMPWFLLDLLFVIFFLIELALRLYAERVRFFFVGWNIFDFCVVFVATVDKFIVSLARGAAGQAEDVLDVVMVVRILRLARILRIVRLLRFCRELWLIVRGIFSAMRTLFWAWMLIVLLCYIGSVFLTRTIGHEKKDDPDVQEHFGTLAKSFFTLFQVLTVDDWVDIVDIADRVAWYARPFFVLFVVCTTFAVLNVVVAVIVEKTLENSMRHSEFQIRQLTKNMRKAKQAIHEIFQIGDTDHDGTLTRDEFLAAIRKPQVMRFLHEVGVDLRRVDQLFDILDYDESGVLDIDEFVDGVMEARGEARSKDVLELHCDLWRWEQTMKREVDDLRQETSRSSSLLNEEVKSIKDAVVLLKQSIAPLL